MKQLQKLRVKIDTIDKQILKLLNKRAELAKKIGKLKFLIGQTIYSPEREKEIIQRLIKLNKGPLDESDIKEIYTTIIHICRHQQKKFIIAYLGPEGTFTHLAALDAFGNKNIYIAKETIGDVFYSVTKDEAEFGVVPVENTTEGIVTHTLDMFLECNLYICGEVNMKISHCLVSKENTISNIKYVYSNPQAIAQCKNYISMKLANAKICEVSSTAEAAKIVANKKNSAAIASEVTAKIYRLNILDKNIQDIEDNYTRFIIIGKHKVARSGHDKTSIMFSLKDRVGILHDALSPFKRYGINLTKIESRPSKQRPWEYVFFVDFVGHINDKNVKKAISELEKLCVNYKFLGSYPRAE
ncbi:MAG: prephenate dehydratase [Endomicrobia bacterium]|nr:prephenate dehydratase [Endomicrobiia bacterium]MCX7940553.1 prephenate dehydratase [Endomicrobiia bacterium]MDW8056038.1 prephenate dehydratase [Elusimicrobiota bacterium]